MTEAGRSGLTSRSRQSLTAFTYLLPAAGFIEIDDDIRLLGLEVGGRVVEGEVAVLADADEGHVRPALRNQLAEPPALFARIRCPAVDEVERPGVDAGG